MAGSAEQAAHTGADITLSTPAGRWIVFGCVLGSGVAGIDATVVNIALPDIGRSLHVGFSTLQWTVTGYTLSLASLILLGGSLGDRFGRRRIFVIGVGWFAIASLLCAIAPNAGWLIGARALQGVGGALLTPASLAILQASFVQTDRARAIGAWSGLSGTASAIAPFLGGWLLGVGSWRWVFFINPPMAVVVIAVALKHMPETRDDFASRRIDFGGAMLGAVALGGITAAAIAASRSSLLSGAVLAPLAVGLGGSAAFLVVEHRGEHPMLPLSFFGSRQFSAANAVTFLLYAANGGVFLLLVLELQTVSGFSPLAAGSALLPITVLMVLLAARFGALAQRIGPRIPMTVGPLVAAAGLAQVTQWPPDPGYVSRVLPAVATLGLGLAIFVAPLTAAVLAAVPAAHAGVASGVNNAVARAAALLAVAILPLSAGLTGRAYANPHLFLGPFRRAIWICAGLQVLGAALAFLTVSSDRHPDATAAGDTAPAGSLGLAGDPAIAGVCRPSSESAAR